MNGRCQKDLRTSGAVLTSGRKGEAEGDGWEGGGEAGQPGAQPGRPEVRLTNGAVVRAGWRRECVSVCIRRASPRSRRGGNDDAKVV